jgi:hypothetical protein
VEKGQETRVGGRVSGPFRSLTKLLCKAGKSLISLSLNDLPTGAEKLSDLEDGEFSTEWL